MLYCCDDDPRQPDSAAGSSITDCMTAVDKVFSSLHPFPFLQNGSDSSALPVCVKDIQHFILSLPKYIFYAFNVYLFMLICSKGGVKKRDIHKERGDLPSADALSKCP